MAGGGIVAAGILLIIFGLVLPGIPAQSTIAGVGGIQVTQTTYPYGGIGGVVVILGFGVLIAGFLIMAGSSRERREKELDERFRFERSMAPQIQYQPMFPQATPLQSLPLPSSGPPEARMFCPACGNQYSASLGKFCPRDATELKVVTS